MECPKCGHMNEEGANFCNQCAASLSNLSSKNRKEALLDEKIDMIQRYLPKGLTEKILSQKGKIEGERKQVTVMFCDMVNFTPMVEKLGPDRAFTLMDQVYEILIHIVHDYEGTVNEMTGDGVLALFGAPIALEDAPQRALRSALAIHDEIDSFNEANDIVPPIKMRVGIHTGPVVVGTLGNDLRVEFKAVGETVNLASRMEGMAEPKSTYVTEDTYRQAKALFNFKSIGEKKVKGKADPIGIYKLVSAKKEIYRPRLGAEREIYSDMVGRTQEINKLQLQVAKLVDGTGSVVSVIGEAGVGKSRLIAELMKRDVISGVTALEGRAISIGRNLSFHPIIDLLKSWAGIREEDDEKIAFSKLKDAVEIVASDMALEIIPFVATLMGINLTEKYAERIKGIEGEALEKSIFKNVRDLLKYASNLTPLVIIIEDLHWSDESSIDLIESLLPMTGEHRLLFVLVLRPDYKETGDRVINTIEGLDDISSVSIKLSPLDNHYSEALISNMLKAVNFPSVITTQIIKRSGGNPYFIEEVVRSFLDEGTIVIENNSFKVTSKIHSVTIPDTINDVLMARIDRLDDSTRNLVKIASVIGRNFFYKILFQVAEEIEDIDDKIGYLKDIQLIREGERLEEVEYLFKHALAQQVTYESILTEKRKDLHLRVANSIEKTFRERLNEFYGLLSYHFANGGDNQKAEEYMMKAGEEALKASASSEALNYYQNALELYTNNVKQSADPLKLAELQENIATAFLNKGIFKEAISYFDKAMVNRGEKLSSMNAFEFFRFGANLISILGSLYLPAIKAKRIPTDKESTFFNKALKKGLVLSATDIQRLFFENIALLKKALKYDISKSQLFFNIVSASSILFSVSGISFSISRKILKFSMESVSGSNHRLFFHYHKMGEIVHDFVSGKWDYQIDVKIAETAIRSGDFVVASSYWYLLGYMNIAKGNFAALDEINVQLDKMRKDYNYIHAELDFYEHSANILLNQGKFPEAIKIAEAGDKLTDKHDDQVRRLCFLGIIVKAQAKRNNYDAISDLLAIADEIVNTFGKDIVSPYFYVIYLNAKTLYSLHLFENSESTLKSVGTNIILSEAHALVTENLKYSTKRMASNRVEAYGYMAKYFWLTKKYKKALKYFDKAIKEGERLGANLELSRIYFEVGKKLSKAKLNQDQLNGISAIEYIEKAKSMFEEMDLQWDLDRLERFSM